MHTLNYGMQVRKLAKTLGISEAEAEALMDKYMATYPAVDAYFKGTQEFLHKRLYVITMLGRIRSLPEARSPNTFERWRAGRQAANFQIQGCQPGDVRVLTRKGYLRLDSLQEGGEVWTGHEWAPFTLLERGTCQLAEIELRNGIVIRCDTRHKLLTAGSTDYEFRKFDELQVGTEVCLSPARPLEFGYLANGLTEEDLYWMGQAVGNGYTSQERGTLTLIASNRKGRHTQTDLLNSFRSYLEQKGCRLRKPHQQRGCVSQTVLSRELRQLWERAGFVWGLTSKEKAVPGCVWTAPLAGRKAFLLGVLDSDGYVGSEKSKSGPIPCIHLGQRPLLRELQTLLRTVGVESAVRQASAASWRLTLYAAQAKEHLGYGFGASKTRSTGSRVPASVASRLSPQSHLTNSQATLLRRAKTGGVLTTYTALQLDPACRAYVTSPIKEVRLLGREETTYTLSVQHPDHRFDSEGVITKNSAAECAKMAMIRLHNEGFSTMLGWYVLAQIHDELITEGPEETKDQAMRMLKECMEDPFRDLGHKLRVKLKAEPTLAHSWYEAKLCRRVGECAPTHLPTSTITTKA